MSIYLTLAPGVKIRIGRRGLRTGIGPRWLRLWGGAGGPGVSSGAGLFTVYRGLGSRRRRRRGGLSRLGRVIAGAVVLGVAWEAIVKTYGLALVPVIAVAVLVARRRRHRRQDAGTAEQGQVST